MVTNATSPQSINGGFSFPESFFAVSEDTKPSDVANGSKLTEIDTGTEYLYDLAGDTWYPFPPADPAEGILPIDADTYLIDQEEIDAAWEAEFSEQGFVDAVTCLISLVNSYNNLINVLSGDSGS